MKYFCRTNTNFFVQALEIIKYSVIINIRGFARKNMKKHIKKREKLVAQ